MSSNIPDWLLDIIDPDWLLDIIDPDWRERETIREKQLQEILNKIPVQKS